MWEKGAKKEKVIRRFWHKFCRPISYYGTKTHSTGILSKLLRAQERVKDIKPRRTRAIDVLVSQIAKDKGTPLLAQQKCGFQKKVFLQAATLS